MHRKVDAERLLKVGWARTSITPEKPVQLLGQFFERVSECVRDPLTATALAVEGSGSAGDQAIVISCDLALIPKVVQESVRQQLADALPEFDERKLVLAATHTHTAPALPGSLRYPQPPEGTMRVKEYVDVLSRRLAAVATEAWLSRSTQFVQRAYGHAAVGFNRRVVYKDGSARMYGDTSRADFRCLEGGDDHGVEMAVFRHPDKRPSGVLVNVACPSQVVESHRFISADFWAETRARLSALHGQEFHVLPLCGAAGDQSPRDLVRRGRAEPNMRSEAGLQELGRRLAAVVGDALEETCAREPEDHPVFRHRVTDIDLPLRRATDTELAEGERVLAELQAQNPDPGTSAWGKAQHWSRILEDYRARRAGDVYSCEVHAVRLGDMALVTNPFELYLDYGCRMKAWSPAEQTAIVQLAGDVGNYLPTQKAVNGGGYGAMICNGHVGPEGGEILVERSLTLLAALWKD
mgnify:CR=1 FL=1